MGAYFERLGVVGAFLVACVLAVSVAAQAPSSQKPVPNVKAVQVVPIYSVEGIDNFTAYCAVCHGRDGQGNGPAAPAMKVPVPDLTTIAKRNNGRFDAVGIQLVVRGTDKASTPAHGVETMPIWGYAFGGENTPVTTLRIGNLVKYLESIQQ